MKALRYTAWSDRCLPTAKIADIFEIPTAAKNRAVLKFRDEWFRQWVNTSPAQEGRFSIEIDEIDTP